MKRRFLLFNLIISLVLICGFMFCPSTTNASELPPTIGVGMFTDNTSIYADDMCTQLVAQFGTAEKGWYINITGVNSTCTAWQVLLNNTIFYIPATQLTICTPEASNTTTVLPPSNEPITDWTHFRVNGQEYVVDQLNGLLASDVMLYQTTLTATKSLELTEYFRNAPKRLSLGTDYRIENLYDTIRQPIEVDCPTPLYYLDYDLEIIGRLRFGVEDNILESAYTSHLYYVDFDTDCTDYANVEWLFGAAVGKEAAPILAQIEKKYGKLTNNISGRFYGRPYKYYEKKLGSGQHFGIHVYTDDGTISRIQITNKYK